MKINNKKILTIIIILLLILLYPITVFANDDNPSISSNSAILIDNNTNKILYSKNENKKMYPASTTKILTAILTLENANLNDVVTASYDSVMSIPDGYSTASIEIGEQLTVEQLLQLLLVHSANDAANILAEYIGGSIDSFVSMMNTKANELNMQNTHFTNTYGKHDENHYTTANDLSILMKYCMKNETFRKIAGSASCAIPSTNKHQNRTYTSTNELLIPNNKNYYKYLTSGKTGYTSQAGECLVSSAYKDNLELICVVLGSSDRFGDTKSLYEYGYSNYSIKNIVNKNDIIKQIEVKNASKETKNLDLLIKDSIPALIKNSNSNEQFNPEITLNDKISAPIDENEVLGKVKYEINGIEYTSDLIASHNVEKSKLLNYILYGLFILILIFLCYKIFYKRKRNKLYRINFIK